MSADGMYVSKSMYPKRGAKWAPTVYPRRNKYAKTKDVREIVKKEVSRLAEDKEIEGTIEGAVFYQGITNTQGLWHIIPNITQGNTQGSRIGNQVRPTKATLRLSIVLNNQSTQYTPHLSTPTIAPPATTSRLS